MIRDKVAKRLRLKHGYKYRANNCYNCVHFKSYKDEEGEYHNTCHLDAGYDNPNQEVYVLPHPYGICDEHERGG